MESTTRKGGANADRGIIQTKTFIFPIEDAEDGYADIEVNDFCKEVKALSMVLDRNNTKLIYRILYKVDYED